MTQPSRTERLAKWQAAYVAWGVNRTRLSEADGGPSTPSANEWQWSDDHAVDLLHEAAELLADKPAPVAPS